MVQRGRRARLGFRYRSNVQVSINTLQALAENGGGVCGGMGERNRKPSKGIYGVGAGVSGGGSEVTGQAGFEISIEQIKNF